MPGVESRHGQTAKRHRPDICPGYCRIRLKYCRDCGMCEMRKCRIWVYNTAVLHWPAPRLLAAMDRAFNPTAPNRHFRVPARLRQRWDCGAFARGGDENALPD